METTIELEGNTVKNRTVELIANNTIEKGNFTALIDSHGRPVINKVTNLSLSEVKRKGLEQFRDGYYHVKDDAGHLIAHMFGGPDSKENIVPQLDSVNRSNMKRVENVVKTLVLEGHNVDYEVRVNYIGSDKRPTSFEPKIYVDGKEYLDLPKELKKIYNTLEPSTVNKVLTTAGERFSSAHEISARTGLDATKLTFAVSAADNISSFLSGDITVEEMTVDIIKDTAVAGALGYGTSFVESTASQALSRSSISLLRSVGGSCLPASAVAFAVESYDAVSQFSRGEIDGTELLYELGDSAASVAGGFGGMKGGAAIGTIVAGPPGTVVGGIVGGLVGCAISTEAYAAAVDAGSEFAIASAEQVEQFVRETIVYVEEYAPEKLNDVKLAFDEFIQENHLPFQL